MGETTILFFMVISLMVIGENNTDIKMILCKTENTDNER